MSRNVGVLKCTNEQLGELHSGEQRKLAEQAPEDLQVRRLLHSPGEDRLRPDRGLLLLLGQRDGRELHREVGEQDHVLHCQCLRTGNVDQTVKSQFTFNKMTMTNLFNQ